MENNVKIAIGKKSDNSRRQSLKSIQFGIALDIAVPSGFDGDGKINLAIYRDEVWYLQRSKAGFTGI